MTASQEDRHKTLDLPDDISLPFFAYGIFKPGQLAYSKIKSHVKKHQDDAEINYEMKHRDGVPILINGEKDYHLTKGSLLTFRQGHEKNAYEIISKTELQTLYEWKTIRINKIEVNILFGVNPENGSDHIESSEERVSFDGKKDPLFSDALELIERNLNSDKDPWNAESFFELQMNYMLLWSAIDRFSSLKYNRKLKKWNNERFAKEKAFKYGIKEYEDKRHRPVYSTEDLTMHEYNVEDPYETLLYYYTPRCNVVHRGKAMIGDYKMLKTATEELLEIFRKVLEDSFEINQH